MAGDARRLAPVTVVGEIAGIDRHEELPCRPLQAPTGAFGQ